MTDDLPGLLQEAFAKEDAAPDREGAAAAQQAGG
jgi:hypothetical protein